MPTLRRSIDGNMVCPSPHTTVRTLLGLARPRRPRMYTWVVVPMPGDRYAVTRMVEIAEKAEDLGVAILDMPLDAIPGLLQPGASVQLGTALADARYLASASPGERIAVLEGDKVLGVLDLGPRRPPLSYVDPWRLGSGAPFPWPGSRAPLSDNYVVLDLQSPVDRLARSLTHFEGGRAFLVVPRGASIYTVLMVTASLLEDLERGVPGSGARQVGDLPLPDPVPAIEQGSVGWRAALDRAFETPGKCLAITRRGRVVAVLAIPQHTAQRPRPIVPPSPPQQSAENGGGGAGGQAAEPAKGVRETEPEHAVEEFEINGADAMPDPGPTSRFFNAGFFPSAGVDPVPTGEPLALDGGPYRLGVNVGKFWGPGEKPEEEFALDGLLKDVLETLVERETLALVVAVRPCAIGRNVVEIDRSSQELQVPKSGDGPLAFFGLTVTREGRHAINVDLFYQGHLLQSMRVEVWVVQQAGLAVPQGSCAQDRWLTFSRTGTLSKDRLAALEKRPSTLTILVEREPAGTDLWFYDVGGHVLGTQDTPVTDAILYSLLGRMRAALQLVENAYAGRIGGDREKLRLSLWRLASVGFEFYRTLLPRVYDPGAPGEEGEIEDLELLPGQVIQVAPLSTLPGVPWELLYDRAVERFREEQPDRVRLCPDFETHATGVCPHQGDSKVVCPSGFWGYRYIIEQLPNSVKPGEQASLADLPLVVRNSVPLRFVPLVYGWDNLASHLAALRALAEEKDFELEPVVTDADGVERVLKEQLAAPADVLYFYAHGGFDDHEPMLQLGLEGAEFPLTAGDLAAWREKIDLSVHQPLVVFNACETAAYLPEHHESLPKSFADRGAAGAIGTQVQVHTTLADRFILSFFRQFLAAQTVGQSLFEARRALLFNYVEGAGGMEFQPDPRGLVYSLFAAADIRLAQPVLPPT